MKFDLNQFLISVSFVLDFIEIDILDDITNHGKRVAYIALKIGDEYSLSSDERFALLSFAIMHDIGGVENKHGVDKTELEKGKNHCVIGEKSIEKFPFFDKYENVILYHHENYDGSGFFNKKGDEIPVFSQIIAIADYFELLYNKKTSRRELTLNVMKQKNKKFSEEIINRFLKITTHESFWLNLKDEFILSAIKEEMTEYSKEYSYHEIHELTALFSDIIDSKSEFTKYHSSSLSKKARVMADFYNFKEEDKYKFVIAADLHDIGKLAISNLILDKTGKLTVKEYEKVKAHTFYTRKALETIDGFEKITEWAANHHEKNDGTGYPYGLTNTFLDFPSQLMVALDIYQALIENRPYRKPMSHVEAMAILNKLSERNKINSGIVKDIDRTFK